MFWVLKLRFYVDIMFWPLFLNIGQNFNQLSGHTGTILNHIMTNKGKYWCKLYQQNFNRIGCLISHFYSNLKCAVKTREELDSRGRLQAMLENIRLGWKPPMVTNTLAYYEIKLNTSVKKFYITGFSLPACLQMETFIEKICSKTARNIQKSWTNINFFLTNLKPKLGKCYETFTAFKSSAR